MGRVKVQLKRLKTAKERQTTYCKRKEGILTKAMELSVLCDVDVVLLMFSPADRPCLFVGATSCFEDVIAKFTRLTLEQRAKSKLDVLEALKKVCKKSGKNFNMEDFPGLSTQEEGARNEEMNPRRLQAHLADLHMRLGYLEQSLNTCNLDHIRAMEETLKESLYRVGLLKENLERRQMASSECTGQSTARFLPLAVDDEQPRQQPLSLLQSQDFHHYLLPNDEGTRDVGSSSVPSNSRYFDVSQPIEEGMAMAAMPETQGTESTNNGRLPPESQFVENYGVQSWPCDDSHSQAGYPSAGDLPIQNWSSSGSFGLSVLDENSYSQIPGPASWPMIKPPEGTNSHCGTDLEDEHGRVHDQGRENNDREEKE